MKKRSFRFLVAAILAIVLAGQVGAADVPDNGSHWYRVIITTGAHTETFTGTSPVPPPELAQRVAKGEAIELQKSAGQFSRSERDQADLQMEENRGGIGTLPPRQNRALFPDAARRPAEREIG